VARLRSVPRPALSPRAPSVEPALLGPAEVRAVADRLGLTPAKRLGQNFVVDPNTVRRIVAVAGVQADDVVLEVGPGIGSLTLGLLGVSRSVLAVEVDAMLAAELPATVAWRAPSYAERLQVLAADALRLDELPAPAPSVLVANLPYNVAVPVVLHLWRTQPSLARGLVMVQAEVGDRLVAPPGSRTYGLPSVKAAWYADVRTAGQVSRTVFWPVPRVDSTLVAWSRREPPVSRAGREAVFRCVDAAFAQRRKTLRSALAGLAGSPTSAADALRRAGVDPGLRGEALGVEDFARIADALAGGGGAR
jgi:16S rRNA (adenine1518-N6/adenine1519-N6)-dimethyltransferase